MPSTAFVAVSWLAPCRPRDAEICHFHAPVRSEQDVVWLHIAVDKAAHVRRFERVRDMRGDCERLRLGKRPVSGVTAP